MEGILKFDLNDPDDAMAHLRAVKSLDMACVLFDLQMNFKKRCEWKFESMSEDVGAGEVFDMVFDELFKVFNDNNVNINELIQ